MNFKRAIIIIVTFFPSFGKVFSTDDSTNSNIKIGFLKGTFGDNSYRIKRQMYYDSELLHNAALNLSYDSRNQKLFSTAKENLEKLNVLPPKTRVNNFNSLPERFFQDKQFSSQNVEFEGLNEADLNHNYEKQNNTSFRFISNENQIHGVQDEIEKNETNESRTPHIYNFKYGKNNINEGHVLNLNSGLSQDAKATSNLHFTDEILKSDDHEMKKKHKDSIVEDKGWSKFNNDNQFKLPKALYDSDFKLNPLVINVNSDCSIEPSKQCIHRFIIKPKSQNTSFRYREIPYEVSDHTLFKKRYLAPCFCL